MGLAWYLHAAVCLFETIFSAYMPAFIHHIATETPEFIYSNEFARERMKGWVTEARAKRMVEMIYERTGIETRSSATDDFLKEDGGLLRTLAEGRINSPTTGEGNGGYAKGWGEWVES